MRARPVRIDQIIPSIVERDAVSHHTLEAQRVLHSMGFVSEIYARNMGPGLQGRVHLLDDIPREGPEHQWVCYQASIGSPAADVFVSHPGLKLVDYHNISPVELVERWLPHLGEEVRLGRKQLAEMAPTVEVGLADSEFNRAELEEAGYRQSTVAPLMVDTSNYTALPDRRVLDRLAAEHARGGHDWLFVGQMLPHKAHQDVIKALACAREIFDPLARLHLVGRESCPAYAKALHRFVAALGLSGAVDFAGSVSAGELSAYYTSADVLVCCSDHEGFCAPLLEAMHHRLPIVAYGVAAIPETVLDAGIVLPSKSPVLVATAVQRVLGDSALRKELVLAGLERARAFSIEGARRGFAQAVEQVLSAP
ncbi:MAG: glycosyltransferase family 4 protein [Acidimicrobiales bacterium]|jgi:glycosyltransferase involved in cell wall biosynthesis